MAVRQRVNLDLDTEVASIVRLHAAEVQCSESEIIERAIRAYDLRSLLATVRARSDLGRDAVVALVRNELRDARNERDAL